MDFDVEVAIVGGGLAGMTMACALGGAGLRCALIDTAPLPDRLSPQFDGRTTALALASRHIMQGIGAWGFMQAEAAPILDIRVADNHAPLYLHYDHREVGDAPFGWIVENRHIRWGLAQRVAELGDVVVALAPASVQAQELGAQAAVLTLADGRRIRARLVVGADGKHSSTRARAGINTTGWSYGQQAIVCTATHEDPHDGVAIEHFMPAGPFAILPLTDDAEGRHRSSIVWTEQPRLVPYLLGLDAAAFSAELARKFGDFWGPVRLWKGQGGPAGDGRFAYPLGLMQANSLIGPRLALVADAAHVIHPIAGQGFNLGIRDIAALAEVVVETCRLGLDIGSAPVLERYQRWRRVDNFTLAAATDVLNRLFSNNIGPVRLVRDLGLAAVGQMPPLKRFFMRHAMGVVGTLPRLARGEGL